MRFVKEITAIPRRSSKWARGVLFERRKLRWIQTDRQTRIEQRQMLREHNAQVESILFSTIVKLGEDKGAVANAAALAALTHALIEIQKELFER